MSLVAFVFVTGSYFVVTRYVGMALPFAGRFFSPFGGGSFCYDVNFQGNFNLQVYSLGGFVRVFNYFVLVPSGFDYHFYDARVGFQGAGW